MELAIQSNGSTSSIQALTPVPFREAVPNGGWSDSPPSSSQHGTDAVEKSNDPLIPPEMS